MPVDALIDLAAGITNPIVSAGATVTGTGVDLGAGGAIPGAGTALYGLVARILVSDAHQTSGGGTVTWTIQHSSDNTNWLTLAGTANGVSDVITLSTTVQSQELFIEFMTHLRYIRLACTVGASGVGNSITFSARLAPAYP